MRRLLCILLPLLLLGALAMTACAPDDRSELRAVTLHELGHLLSLGHSGERASIMYPIVDDGSHLTEADIAAGCAAILDPGARPICFDSATFWPFWRRSLESAIAEWNDALGTTWFSQGSACAAQFAFADTGTEHNALAFSGPPARIVFSDAVHWY